jgi:hypothetical protein
LIETQFFTLAGYRIPKLSMGTGLLLASYTSALISIPVLVMLTAGLHTHALALVNVPLVPRRTVAVAGHTLTLVVVVEEVIWWTMMRSLQEINNSNHHAD